MANVYQPIVPGQPGWVDPLNAMLKYFGTITADSGWIDLPMKNVEAPEAGLYLRIRTVGPMIAIRTQLTVLHNGTTVIADIPVGLINEGWRYFSGFQLGTQGVQLKLNEKQGLEITVPLSATKAQINLDTVIMSASW